MGWSGGGWNNPGWSRQVPIAATPYTWLGAFSDAPLPGTSSVSTSIDIGAAAANRIIFAVAFIYQPGSLNFSSLTVNGVSLTQVAVFSATDSGNIYAIYRGVVASGSGSQTVTLTASGNINPVAVGFGLWSFDGAQAFQSSTEWTQGSFPADGSSTISVDASDFMFGIAGSLGSASTDFSSSTQTPNIHRDPFVTNIYYLDWSITSTDSSFVFDGSNSSAAHDGLAANFR